MKSVGYVNTSNSEAFVKEQVDALEGFEVEEIIYETVPTDGVCQNYEALDEAVSNLEAQDQLVVYELCCLGKSVIQLASFLSELKEKDIQFVELKRNNNDSNLSDETYIDLILKIADMEKVVIRERTTKGLKEARRKGRIGGRPKISQETVNRIKTLYQNKRYTLRQIAEECNISLGTAYKYVQKN